MTEDCTFFQVGFKQSIKEDWTLLQAELDIVLLKIAHFFKLIQLKYLDKCIQVVVCEV